MTPEEAIEALDAARDELTGVFAAGVSSWDPDEATTDELLRVLDLIQRIRDLTVKIAKAVMYLARRQLDEEE